VDARRAIRHSRWPQPKWRNRYRVPPYLALENPLQLQLHPGQADQSNPCAGSELHQHIDIAVGPKVIPQNRSEERQPMNVVAPAKVGDFSLWNIDMSEHGG
jgi:hypothetical protein